MEIVIRISPDDIKTLRKLAKMKNVQDLVKLTPTVNVQVGDNQKHLDIDTIIENITKRLREEIAASTKIVCEVKEKNRFVGTVKIDDSIVTAINEATDELKRLVE